MQRRLTLFLQTFIILIGIGFLTFLLWEPQIEGVNAHATQFAIYFQDPFLAYVYLGSIPFFIALYHAFKLVGYLGKNSTFSQSSVLALRNIKYCAILLVFFIAGAETWIMLNRAKSDDIAGGVAMGLLMGFIAILIAITAALFEKRLQKA